MIEKKSENSEKKESDQDEEDDDEDEEFDEDWDDMDDDSKENDDGSCEMSEDCNDDDDNEDLMEFSNRRSSVDPSQTRASPDGGSHDNHVWTIKDVTTDEELSSSTKRMDFAHVEMSNRKHKRKISRFSMIQEETEDDEESTVDAME